jgi:RpiR family transcriptional regulator, carbohydrate utilization regulator
MKKKQTSNNGGILALNRSMLSTMPRALRGVAEIAATDPLAVTRMTVEELASKAKCSEGTVIRWCKELGFSGFQELKLSLAFDSALKEATTIPGNQHAVFASIRAALNNTEALLDQDMLKKAAQKIMKAKTILVVGVGASADVGKYLHYRLLRTGILCDFHSDMHTGLMAASVLDANSVLIAVSNSGSTIDINEVAQRAAQSKATTIALTNHARSRLTKNVDITLLAGSSSDYPLAGGSALSVITLIAIIECLFETIVSIDPKRAEALVTTAESVLKRLY